MNRTELWFGLGTALLVIVTGVSMTLSDAKKRDAVAAEIASKPPREHNLAVFDAATSLLETYYYDSELFTTSKWRQIESRWRDRAAGVEPGRLYRDVLNGLAREFPDSHVAFAFPPRSGKEDGPESETGPLEAPEQIAMRLGSGPGFEAVTIRRGAERPYVVDDVMRGSPAERAGITPGWVILNDNVDITDDHARFQGEFLALDADSSRDVEKSGRMPSAGYDEYSVTRNVKVEFELEKLPASHGEAFERRDLAGGVTYLRFDVFEETRLVERVIGDIDAAGPAGLIVDLRRNPGGRLLQLQRVAGGLLGRDVLLGTQRVANSSQQMRTWRFTDHYHGPLVVLIGPSTASAAEILAAAVQDQRRGKIIGRASNGSVVPSEWFELPDGGRMMIPMSDFVRSDGRRIEGAGVQPDIWVLPTIDDVREGRDPALASALRELKSGTF